MTYHACGHTGQNNGCANGCVNLSTPPLARHGSSKSHLIALKQLQLHSSKRQLQTLRLSMKNDLLVPVTIRQMVTH